MEGRQGEGEMPTSPQAVSTSGILWRFWNEEAELMKVNSLKDLKASWKEVLSFQGKKEWGWEASTVTKP